LVSDKSIIVFDSFRVFEIVGFFFNISGFRNRLSLFIVFVDVDGLSSISFVKSASVDAAVDSISTLGNSGKSGSCGVNDGFLKENFSLLPFFRRIFVYFARISFINSCRDRFSNACHVSNFFGINVGNIKCSAKMKVRMKESTRWTYNRGCS
jgi:hypothetical protein